MSAREKLFEDMAGGWSLTQAEAAPLYQAIDSALDIHAHELAERIRAGYGGEGPDGDNWITNPYDAADLIDPTKSAGPVRPDEEPTP